MALLFVLDEHLRGPLWRAIQRHNLRGADPIDAVRVGDPLDLPLGTDDPAILLWAEREGRVLVSFDWDTMIGHLNSVTVNEREGRGGVYPASRRYHWPRGVGIMPEKIHKDDRVSTLERQVSRLAAKLKRAEARLAEIEPASIVVPISTLAPEPLEIIGPINAVVQENDGSYVASFLEANLGASGETKAEALNGLKDRIVTTFERLEGKPESRLGPGPLNQKRVLTSLIRRR